MCATSKNIPHFAFYERECKHEVSLRIYDYANGCEVCSQCGLVLSEQLFTCYNHSKTYNPKNNEKDGIVTFNGLLQESLNLIEETCQKYNISAGITQAVKRELMLNEKHLKYSKQQLLSAYCFFKASQQNNSIRTKQEICQMFKVTPKKFQEALKNYETEKNQIDLTKPSDIFPRLEIMPPLQYKTKLIIQEKADLLFKTVNASPAAVLAYTIYTYFKEHAKELNRPKMSMLHVSKLCNVSTTSIKRLSKNKTKMIM